MQTLLQNTQPVIRQDRLYLTGRPKFFVKLNCLITLLAIGLASRPESISLLTKVQAQGRLGSSAMADKSADNDSDRHSGQADPPPTSPTTSTYPKMKIDHMRLHKSNGFPALLNKNGRPISTAELPSFEARLDSWASGAGLEALCSTTADMIRISENQTTLLPYFGEEDVGNLKSIEQKRLFFSMLAKTDMGSSLNLPDDDETWSKYGKEDILDMERKLTTISAQLSRNLAEAVIIKDTNHTAFPQYFESSLALALTAESPRMVKGFIQLQQLRMNLNRDPQGSCLAQQNEAIKKFTDASNNHKLTIYEAQALLVESYGPTHIIAARDEASRDTFYRRLTLAASETLTRACENERVNNQLGATRQNAAVIISMALTSKKLTEPKMTWQEFYTFITGVMAEHLPALDNNTASTPTNTTHHKHTSALNAQMQRHGQKSNHNTSWSYTRWTCANCGTRGHHEQTCTAPFDPSAPAKAELARAEAIRKRKVRDQSNKDRFKQQKVDNRTTPPAPAPAASTAEHPTKQVKASLSMVTKMNDGLHYQTERGMIAQITRTELSQPQQCVTDFRAHPTVIDTFAIITGCWLALLVLNISYQAACSMPHGTTTAAYLILSTTLAGMLLITMGTEAAKSATHLRTSTISYVMLMLIVTFAHLMVGAQAAPAQQHTAFVTNVPMHTPAFAGKSMAPCTSPRHRMETVYLDSGCSKTVFANPRKLINHRPPDAHYTISGVGGAITATAMGDFPLALRDKTGRTHTRLIKDCLIAEDAPYNLLSTRDIQLAKMGFTTPADINQPAIVYFEDDAGRVSLELEEHGGLYKLPFCQDIMTTIAGVSSHQLRALTEAEKWHLRMGHAGWDKIATLSKIAKGFHSPIARHDYPCHTCHEAKARRQNYPPPSAHERDGVWCMDTIDMGEENTTPAGNRYITVVTIIDTRFLMVFLHRTKDEFPRILLKAFAQAGKLPKILRTDNASELNSQEVQDLLLERGVVKENSNAYEQFGNAPAEIMVNTIDNGVRAALKDANLPLHYWGFAVVNWVDIYNHLPHSALDDKTPWECEKGTPPDVSWFRPFGCRATVFTGMRKDLTEHGKLAPRGVACIYLGLGFSRGHKGWICYDPEGGNLFCTRNVVFDETFMPARTHDQRILGYYDTTPRTRMAKQIHGSMEAAERAAEDIDGALPIHGSPPPIADLPDDEREAIQRKPGDRIDHEEGDALINAFEEDDEDEDLTTEEH